MSSATVSSDQVEPLILHEMSWDSYERLLSEIGDSPGKRVTYDSGLLQIMVISAAHDNPNRTIASIVEIVAEETGADVCHLGSTTFKRPDLQKGFEPDSCFYFRDADAVRDVDEIDLTVHPPPELVIEVDISSDSLNRFPVFAAVGVAEVWRFANGSVTMYALRGASYEPVTASLALPVLTPEAVTQFVGSYRRMKWTVWVRWLREWVRAAG